MKEHQQLNAIPHRANFSPDAQEEVFLEWLIIRGLRPFKPLPESM
jgi:hypothetical protein